MKNYGTVKTDKGEKQILNYVIAENGDSEKIQIFILEDQTVLIEVLTPITSAEDLQIQQLHLKQPELAALLMTVTHAAMNFPLDFEGEFKKMTANPAKAFKISVPPSPKKNDKPGK